MDTTTLVHESFLRLVQAQDLDLNDRHHFFAYAAKAMRNVIIDAARHQQSARRGGGHRHVTLEDDAAGAPPANDELLRVNNALQQLEAVDPVLAEVVDMRYFGGYSEREIAALQGVDERTVRRRWDRARVWLFVALE
jgi:RNA polymerase sigma factor (TIGR02999 family)